MAYDSRVSSALLDESILSAKRGHKLEDFKDYENAIKHFDEAISVDSNNFMAYYGKGIALSNLGKNKEAIKYFDQAIRLNPDKNFYLSSHKINALKNLKQYDNAVKCYDETVRSEINFNSRLNRLIINRNFESYEHVLNDYEKNRRKNLVKINYSVQYFKKGKFLLDVKNFHVALKCFDKAIQLDPDYAEAYFYKGVTLKHLKMNKEAKIYFDKAKELMKIDEE